MSEDFSALDIACRGLDRYIDRLHQQDSKLAALRAEVAELKGQLDSANKDFEKMNGLFNEVAAKAFQLGERAEGAERKLGDLLARIHRDGGQYTAEHGVAKSVEDAHIKVAQLLHKIAIRALMKEGGK